MTLTAKRRARLFVSRNRGFAHEKPDELACIGDDQHDNRNVHRTIDARPQLSQLDTESELTRQHHEQNH